MNTLTDEIFAPARPGYWLFGGAFVPEILRTTLDELIEVFDEARADESFWHEFVQVMQSYSAVQPQLLTWKT